MMPDFVTILSDKILSDNWGKLHKIEYKHTLPNGQSYTDVREAYDRGNGAVILLYNIAKGTVILTRQLRIPTYVNGNATGMMIEACAGMLDENDPEECIRRETQEETGYTLTDVKKVMEVYMSPGGVTEILYFFIAAYSNAMKTGEGGGLEKEHENIEVLEMPFNKAFNMISTGEIKDAKTIMLLQHARLEGIL
ncbi:GDP-mannose pyrophosphatase [Flavobacterium rivuli WB 3.3-2 = DSM 21788]|uniref:GDP-mannose pyrophosphatase n=2 Tax=Flavobacterium rivuli TaxID=498301 RepID=A0A0A2M4T1_9FLAO|nr:GDP-mannose pyrophosphatase [Flavobacterium rivuli WB 3.3-2 = DSM 21788]